MTQRVLSWGEQAKAQNLLEEYQAAIADLYEHLSYHPHDRADILKQYKSIDAREYMRLVPNWFIIWYGVEERARTVMLRKGVAAPGSPLF